MPSYNGPAQSLLADWQKRDFSTLENAVQQILAFSPFTSSRKPGYSYQIFIAKVILSYIAPSYLDGALLILVWSLYVGSVILSYVLMTRWGIGPFIALIFAGIPLFSQDVYINARIGYHTLSGLFWFLLALYLWSLNRPWPLLAGGFLACYAIFASPPIIVVFLGFALYQGGLLFFHSAERKFTYKVSLLQLKKLSIFAGGSIAALALSELTYRIRLELDGATSHPIKDIFGAGQAAQSFGGRLPFSPEFIFRYGYFALGLGFVILILLSLFYLLQNNVSRTFPNAYASNGGMISVIFLVSWALIVVLKLPAIGRVYTPALWFLIFLAAFGLEALFSQPLARRYLVPHVLAVSTLAISVFHFYVVPEPDAGPQQAYNRITNNGEDAVSSSSFRVFSRSQLNQELPGKILVIRSWHHFAHFWFSDCDVLFPIAAYVKETNPEILLRIPVPEGFGTCFESEFGYQGLCKDWRKIYSDFTYFEVFAPGDVVLIEADPFLTWLNQDPNRQFEKCPKP
ncbi:MAG: hypothetical protein RRB13_02845 [bacterium]|nr:hypothetical protein [bacterium]